MTELAIKVENVTKDFVLHHNRNYNLKEKFVSLASGRFKENREHFRALDDVSVGVGKGEAVGLLGRNGSGKSTLLKLIAGIITPTLGNISVSGRIAPFIELGVGFNPQLTGEENIFLNGTLYGCTNRELRLLYDDILEFSELGDFIDIPLKNYSSGMQMRLGFSIAVHLEPQILLADEVLAVGDASFQEKCLERIKSLRANGMTLLLVSHSEDMVHDFCDRFFELEHGKVVRTGPTRSNGGDAW